MISRDSYPEEDDVVIVNVESLSDFGFECSLPEFGHRSAFLPTREFSIRQRMKRAKLVQYVGRQICCVVVNVDIRKGFIDLSKKIVDVDMQRECLDRFKKSSTVDGIVSHLCHKFQINSEKMYELVIQPLLKVVTKLGLNEEEDSFSHPLDILELIGNDNKVCSAVITGLELEDEKLGQEFATVCLRRLKKKPIRIVGNVEVTCYSVYGITAIKKALLEAQSLSENIKIVVQCAPSYAIVYDPQGRYVKREHAVREIEQCYEKIREVIVDAPYHGKVKKPINWIVDL